MKKQIWFTSDQHFFHKNIIMLDNRPFHSLEHMHQQLVSIWNHSVAENDLVYILGDLVFGGRGNCDAIIPELKGQKVLIKGNHDSKYTERHCAVTLRAAQIKIAGELVNLSHYPYQNAGDHVLVDGEERFYDRRLVADGRWLLHGHVHNNWFASPDLKMINVGCMHWNWAPVSIDTIAGEIMKCKNKNV